MPMKKHFSNILHGMGSVLEVYPNTDYRRFLPKGTDADRLRSDWQKVGQDISSAIQKVAGEYQNKEKK